MRARWGLIAVALGCVVALSGCAPAADEPDEQSGVTWEEGKAQVQATEMEIASLIPDDVVARIDQKPEGTLFSCGEEQHRWKGSTTVVLLPEADATAVVKQLESDVKDVGRFDVESWVDVTDTYSVQLTSPGSAENHVLSEGEPHTIRIASGSVCFTLPEGVYPGGTF